MASGRTDRGVHARCQPVSVRVPVEVPLPEVAALGGADWGVAIAAAAPEGFHAQWSSVWKEYRYRLSLGPPPSDWEGLTWQPEDGFDLTLFRTALLRAEGSRDFGAFHARSSLRRMRTLVAVQVVQAGQLLEVRLRGDGFGRFGVRLLVGGAARLATGSLGWHEWEAALDHGAPIRGLRAPAAGLTLWAVGYPELLDPFAGAEARLPGLPPFTPLGQE
jgi:tRNA pseudouridine38-40 synthase